MRLYSEIEHVLTGDSYSDQDSKNKVEERSDSAAGNKIVRTRAPSKMMLIVGLSDRPQCGGNARRPGQAVVKGYSGENAEKREISGKCPLTLVRGYIHMGHTSAARPPRPPPRPRLILSREITFWASNIKRAGGLGRLKTIHALGLSES